jgi:hypothetical protein
VNAKGSNAAPAPAIDGSTAIVALRRSSRALLPGCRRAASAAIRSARAGARIRMSSSLLADRSASVRRRAVAAPADRSRARLCFHPRLPAATRHARPKSRVRRSAIRRA